MRTLLIAGMHRSGTSFLANWLEKCGLHLGSTLIPGDFSNPAGHFEDETFSQFQRRILKTNGADYLVTDERFRIDAALYDEAQALVDSRSDQAQWGWKDPRTTLLLDFWEALLPDMRVILVYRPAHQVVDSLLRREAARRLRSLKGYHPRRVLARISVRMRFSFFNWHLVRHYGRVWKRYNADGLAFYDAHPERTLVLSLDDVLQHSQAVIAFMNHRWGFAFQTVDARDVFRETLLTTSSLGIRGRLLRALVPNIAPVAAQLEAARQQNLARLQASVPSPAPVE